MNNVVESKSICVMPWIHLNIWTDGRIIPCCLNQEYAFGHAHTDTIEAAYNSSTAQKFRHDMLNGKLPESCRRCKYQEEVIQGESYRQTMNRKYNGSLREIMNSPKEHTKVNFNFKYLDVRFSNLCNFSCKTCDQINSSGYAQDLKSLQLLSQDEPTIKKAFKSTSDFLPFFEKNITTVEEIYFCGGEPLILKEHYEILDLLIAHKKFDTELRYNTNLSNLKFGSRSVIDLWKQFGKIRIGASLDASHERAEYMRKGTVWSEIEINRKIIQSEVPHAYFYIQPTVQLMNAFHLPDFHLDWVERGLLQPNEIFYNLLTDPYFYSAQTLTENLKLKVNQKWLVYIEKLKLLNTNAEIIAQAQSILRYILMPNSDPTASEKLTAELEKHDKLNHQNFSQTFPEFNSHNDGVI